MAIRKGPRTHGTHVEKDQADIPTKCALWIPSPPQGQEISLDTPLLALCALGCNGEAGRLCPRHSPLVNEARDSHLLGQAATVRGASFKCQADANSTLCSPMNSLPSCSAGGQAAFSSKVHLFLFMSCIRRHRQPTFGPSRPALCVFFVLSSLTK